MLWFMEGKTYVPKCVLRAESVDEAKTLLKTGIRNPEIVAEIDSPDFRVEPLTLKIIEEWSEGLSEFMLTEVEF